MLVREFVEAVNRQDWQRFDELVAPEFVCYSGTFGQSRVSNREMLPEYLIDEFKTFADARESINFMAAEGDKVAVHSHFHAVQQGPVGKTVGKAIPLTFDYRTYTVQQGLGGRSGANHFGRCEQLLSMKNYHNCSTP